MWRNVFFVRSEREAVKASESWAKLLQTTEQLSVVKESQPNGATNQTTGFQTPVCDIDLVSSQNRART